MKNTLLLSIILFSAKFIFGGNITPSNKNTNQISFKENKGQVSDQNYKPRPDVLFSGNANGLTYHLKKDGISYQLYKVESWKEKEDIKHLGRPKEIAPSTKVADKISVYRLDVNWLNTNKNVIVEKGKEISGYDNYYLTVCPDGVTNVKTYKDVLYKNLYNGIDLHYYSKDGNLKYDYIVAPGADYKKIQFRIEGAKKITLQKDGSIILKTPLGGIQEGSPVAYQNRKKLSVKWKVKNNLLSFEIENYDTSKELVIDPPTRVWGTYYGGTGFEISYSCATDDSCNVYMAGQSNTSTSSVIATTGSHNSNYSGGADAILVKFNSNGIRKWGTYYGGTGGEIALSCSTDLFGNAYLAGYTDAFTGSVMTTTGCHQNSFGGGTYDAFLAKFDRNGVRKWGTYYGGNWDDLGVSCDSDSAGNVYLAGYTTSSTGTVIASTISHQNSYGGGSYEAFLVKFNSNGVRQWGTYYGGSGADYGSSCSTDASGNVYLSGETNSNTGTVVASSGSHQNTFGGGNWDAFLVKFDSSGVRQWGTYYGGAGDDFGYSCATDIFGNLFLTGYTGSNTGTVIATLGSHQNAFGGGMYDIFLTKFNSNGIRQWGTYYGGIGDEEAWSCATSISGNVFIAGYTGSNISTSIATAGSHQSIFGGGVWDSFLAKFNNGGVLQWGTYYGGIGNNDNGYSCSTDKLNNVYLAGRTDSNTGNDISSIGGHQPIYGGGVSDGFLVQFFDCLTPAAPVNTTSSFNLNICAGNSATLSATASSTVDWFSSVNSTVILANGSSYITPTLTAGTYTYYTETTNTCSASPRTPVTLTVNPSPTVNISSGATLICVGQTTTITATGSGVVSYTWSTSSTGSVIIVSPTVTTNYTVIGTDANGCNGNAAFTQSVSACTGINELPIGIVSISPNPNNGEFTITLNSLSKNIDIEIYNALGQIIKRESLVELISKLSMKEQANGIYFVKVIKNGRSVYNTKIVKE